MSLLDPKILMAIKDLPLAAKTTVDGFLAGINKSTIKGPGLEFSQYRSYQPGDDLRSLDWKMYARSDRYYIRESEVETSISVKLLVDASGSMNHEDGGFQKIEYCRYLAASLAYLAQLYGNATGLNVLSEGALFALPSRQDHQHLQRILFQLEQIRPNGSFTNPIHYREMFGGTQKRELLIFITDMYQRSDEIYALLDALGSLKHEIILFHLMARNEYVFDYRGYTALEDLETGEVVPIDSRSQTRLYQQRLQDYLAQVRTQLLDRQIVYRLLYTDMPLDQALRDFLNHRNKSSF